MRGSSSLASLRALVAPVLSAMLVVAGPSILTGCGGGGGGGEDDGGGGSGLPATASAARGALLYDTWWDVTGDIAPATTNPAYPKPPGTLSGSTTWRCAECHGFDYKGAAGAYASGSSHYSGVAGLFTAAGLTPQAVFDAIAAVGTTHEFPALATADVWDLAAFVKQGLVDMNSAIDLATGVGKGSSSAGQAVYTTHCASCHGADGKTLNLGNGDGVGDRANDDPWEVLHAIRWGKPDTGMPSMVDAGLTATQQSNLLAYAQSLGAVAPPPPPPPPPTTLSYATDIKPIWAARSCTGCHGTSGGLTLSGTTAASYAELFEVAGRINLTTPANSLILRKPATSGVSHGGGKIFPTTSDVDYQKILTWITQGALNN